MASFNERELESAIRNGVQDLMSNYDEEYWRSVRLDERFPETFWRDLADHGWTGIVIPEDYGGQGLGVQDAVTVIEEVGLGGGWWVTNNFARTPVFLATQLMKNGSAAQKERWLPEIAAGEAQFAMAVTEPNAGLNTPEIETRAEREGDEYVINGRKVWISSVEEADRILVLARTTPLEAASKRGLGITEFLIDPTDSAVDYDEIPSDLTFNDRAYNVYFDNLRVPASAVVGEVDQGLYQIFDTLNCERITMAAHTLTLGRYALQKAVEYAKEREVFDAPIGSHQAIQHPLADAYADMETARLAIEKGAWMYDNREEVGSIANIANLKAAEAAWDASEAAMTTYGGMSASRELGIATIWQIVRHLRAIPVSEQMIHNYIAQHELGLPKSY